MNDYSGVKRIVGIILVVIAIVMVLFFGFKYYKEKPLYDGVRATYNAYQQGEYQQALAEANKLEEPYKSYYVDYINYAIEINEWNDTDDALYAWLLEFYESYKKYSQVDFTNNIKNMKLWDVPIEEPVFEAELEYIEEALVWYPQYCTVKNSFYDHLFSQMKKNSDLYLAVPEDGYVKICAPEVAADYEAMKVSYDGFVKCIEDIRSSYKMNEEFNSYLDEELLVMKDFYENGYIRSSLYTIYEDAINEKSSGVVIAGQSRDDFLYVSEENAKHNYELILNNYDAIVYGGESIEDMFMEALASSDSNEVRNNSIVVLEMYNIIKNMYVLEKLEVQSDPNEVDITEIYEKYF
ncbi:MAG: hypothetical protein IJC02_00265 [Lachnospiraceae bacterium]|nr:hypothetical protein [Lachnospiraceae bacterium]